MRPKKEGKIHIGTSGWYYSHWKGPFYPIQMPSKEFLSYYMDKFPTVEINRTFYSLPDKKVFAGYAKKASSSFIFSVKASRFITHIKRFKDCEEPIKKFISLVSELKKHLGPLLFLVPPNWAPNIDRLHSFLDILPDRFRYTFEFRDERWVNEETISLLKQKNMAFCISQFGSFLTPRIVTANFIYVRLHGPKKIYGGSYSIKTLKSWADFFREEAAKGHDIFCYFDNDEAGYAAKNAMQLIALLEKSSPQWNQ